MWKIGCKKKKRERREKLLPSFVESVCYVAPVCDLPPLVDVFCPVVFIDQIVRMFPYVDAEEYGELREVHEVLFFNLSQNELVGIIVVEQEGPS